MFNTHTEEFRRNAVAVVRSGYGIANLAKRLHVPPSSIRNWVGDPRYSDIAPADGELLAMIPQEPADGPGLVQISRNGVFLNENDPPILKIRIGSAETETPENNSAGSVRILIETLRDSHAL